MKEVINYYTNYDEDSRLERHRTEFVTTTYILDKFILNETRILDVAAGTGAYSIHFAEKGCSVTAMDITPKHIEILNSKLKNLSHLDISASIGDARDLSSLGSGSFDVVLCMGPVYHVSRDDLEHCFGQCVTLLKHDGILAVAYLNKYEGYRDDNYKDLLSFYTPTEIDDMLSGFDMKKVCNVPTDGEIFRGLNDLATQIPHNLAKLHAWLDNNREVFEDPVWKHKSVHALFVGTKT